MAINWKKVLWGLGIGAAMGGVTWGGFYLNGLLKLSRELKVEQKGMIYKVTLTGLTIRVLVTLRNPTSVSADLSKTRVEVLYKDKVLASSKKQEETFTIPKEDYKEMEPIDIELDLLKVVTSIPALVKEYRSTGKITLTVDVRTEIDKWYKYKKVEDIKVGGKEDEEVNGIRQHWLLNDMRNSWG